MEQPHGRNTKGKNKRESMDLTLTELDKKEEGRN